MIYAFREIYRFRHVPAALVYSALKKGTAGTRFGHLWWLIDPIVMMVVYYAVVVLIFERGGPGYHIFLLSALVSWQWFARSVQGATASLTQGANMLRVSNFPSLSLIISPIITNLIYALFGFTVVLFFSMRMPGFEIVYLPLIVIVQALFTFAITPMIALFNVLIPDTQRAIGFILRAWWFLSPVLYGVDRVLQANSIPEWAKTIFMANPFTILLPAYRHALTGAGGIDLLPIGYLTVASMAILQVSLFLYRRLERRVKKFL